MARLPYVEREDLPEEYRYIFDNLTKGGGSVGNLQRTLGHQPRLLLQFSRLGSDLRNKTALDPRLRELAILTVGRLASAVYEYTHHVRIGRGVGLTEAQIDFLPVWERHPAFSEQERAVIRYAEVITRDIRVPDEVFDAVAASLDHSQMVELTLTIAFYNLVVRFLEPLEVDLEDETVN
ncbi:MAG: carboxymuconolactone decarboxylase family protein [Dehalococcoidia bacterium]